MHIISVVKLKALGHDARLMPAKYVRPYSKGQKNDFRDAEAIAEAVQRPTMKFVATKTPSNSTCGPESRFRKSCTDDKWSFCLTVGTLCLRNQERL